MAIYHFQNKPISRGNGQNAVAKSAYNSASKIKDYEENRFKDFSNKQCDYSQIFLPENADENFKDREYLWNKVHEKENRKDSRLAREFILALPSEFDEYQNIELAQEFTKSLVNEGMVVDLNIHDINSENPHAHLLCTVRGFDINGNFEPKRKGNKRVRDWDTNNKHLEWRKRWEIIQNKHLERNGFSIKVSSESYKNQNIELEPTKKEGWKARKFEDETGNKSNISKYNDMVKEENKKKIDNLKKETILSESKKYNSFDYLKGKDINTVKNLAKDLKLYISPINLYEEKERLSDLKEKTALISDSQKVEKKLEEITDRRAKIDKLNSIFEEQAEEFFNNNMGEYKDEYSPDEKIYITRYILNEQHDIPNFEEIDNVINEKRKLEAQISLNTLLGDRKISLESIDQESEFFTQKLDNMLKRNNISFDDVLDNGHKGLEDESKINYYTNKLDSLRNAEEILDDYYDLQIRELFNDDDDYKGFIEVTSIEEKRQFLDFKAYHGADNTIEMLNKELFIPKYSNEDRHFITEKLKVWNDIENKPFKKTQNEEFMSYSIRNQLAKEYDFNVLDSNDIKHILQEAKEVEDFISEENIENISDNQETINEYSSTKMGNSMFMEGVDSMIFNFNEIFRDRLPKQTNKQLQEQQAKKRRRGMQL